MLWLRNSWCRCRSSDINQISVGLVEATGSFYAIEALSSFTLAPVATLWRSVWILWYRTFVWWCSECFGQFWGSYDLLQARTDRDFFFSSVEPVT